MILFIFVVRRLFGECGCVFRLMRCLLVLWVCVLFVLFIGLVGFILFIGFVLCCGRINSVGGLFAIHFTLNCGLNLVVFVNNNFCSGLF